MTHVVNGLTCVCENFLRLTLYNICTGQRMIIDESLYFNFHKIRRIHLGYDSGSNVYKLLRLIMPDGFHYPDRPLEAEILTLKPSTSLSLWRKLDNNACGIADFPDGSDVDILEAKTFSGDGILCWFRCPKFLLSFDLNKEKFQCIKLPEDVIYTTRTPPGGLPYNLSPWNLVQSMGRLALWLPPHLVDHTRSECFVLFVLEDNEGNRWSKHCIQLPEELDGDLGSYASAVGNLPTGELLLMNPLVKYLDQHPHPNPVYSYDHYKFDRFLVGKLPVMLISEETPNLDNFYIDPLLDDGGNYGRSYRQRFHDAASCLLDNSNLYLPLDDVLRGGVED
ncbi:OLC1v1006192C1 [Oldenlandia corymbosa var. corymbosa]|uniref:OLC1v1006192C1 n=1 Tax=Oldenlandia corymbosa var. corymbosa TaxID=529605 RepID=A0AAV1DII2_OLDCO|nr:OLC1v1006192C1 [Oldenlandia corymbosa var. corymbosa]